MLMRRIYPHKREMPGYEHTRAKNSDWYGMEPKRCDLHHRRSETCRLQPLSLPAKKIEAFQTKITADTTIDTCTGQEWDMIAVLGGVKGAERLRR